MPTRSETLLEVATWLKWIRDDALDDRPALPVSIDELNQAIQVLEHLGEEFAPGPRASLLGTWAGCAPKRTVKGTPCQASCLYVSR